MVMALAWLLMVTSVLVTLAIIAGLLRLLLFCSGEARHDTETPLTALLAKRRRAAAAARHAALPPVRVVSVTRVNERKALP